jgi:hypothetical protein
VGLVTVEAQPAQHAAERAPVALRRRNRHDVLVDPCVDAGRIHRQVPGCRVVESVATDIRGHALVKYLAHSCGEITVGAKVLGQCHDVRLFVTEVFLQTEHPGLVRILAGEETGPALVALGVLGISAGEQYARPGQTVDVRGLNLLMVVGPDVGIQIINNHEQDVGRTFHVSRQAGIQG